MGISRLDRSHLGISHSVVSRRGFVTSAIASGIAVSFSRLAVAEEPSFDLRETLPGRQRWNPAATGAGRIDGVAKVSGSKLYASDFRAADMPGWPTETSHAILVRAPDATHVYTGLDLSRLTGAAKPSVVVTADDLVKAGTRVPQFYAGDLFCPVGRTPLYLGQPVALLLFDTFDGFDQARVVLRDQPYIKFGEETGPVVMPDYGAWRFTFVAGPTPEAPDVYSPVKDGWINPPHVQNTELPVWTPQGAVPGSAYEKGAIHGQKIHAELAADNPAVLVLDREFATQSIDPGRAGMRDGTTAAPRNSNWYWACSRPGRRRKRWHSSSARRARLSSRPASPAILPTSAAASADATTRRSRCTWRWRRCSFPAGRSASPMTVFSSFRAASSGILLR
jgi:hypothetical protein